MVEALAVVYLSGVVGMAIFWTMAFVRTNGFQGFANLANRMTKLDKTYSSLEVQWASVLTTIFWPVVMLILWRTSR